MFHKRISWLGMGKLNVTQQKHTFTNQKKCTTTQNKLKPGLVASYDIWPGNGEGLFWFQRFINLPLTYLLKTPTYLQPRDPHHVANVRWFDVSARAVHKWFLHITFVENGKKSRILYYYDYRGLTVQTATVTVHQCNHIWTVTTPSSHIIRSISTLWFNKTNSCYIFK